MSIPTQMSKIVPKLTRKVFGQKATLLARLVLNWPDIVGQTLANRIIPAELNYQSINSKNRQSKTVIISLYVRDGATALEIQYQTELIIEKINRFLGYGGVHGVRFLQAPEMFKNKGRKKYIRPKKLSRNEHEDLIKMIDDAHIEEDELSKALKSLGESILLDGK